MLIDAQHNMLDGSTPVPAARTVRRTLADLLARARSAGALVVHVQNDGAAGDPDEPHTEGWELVLPTRPGEPVLRKRVADAFEGTDLAAILTSRGVRRVVVAGVQSEFCVDATSRGALARGLEVVLASGAHATYDGQRSATEVSAAVEAALIRDGARAVPAHEVVFEEAGAG